MALNWTNNQTTTVFELLERDDAKNQVVPLVEAWSETGGLLVELADEFEGMVGDYLTKHDVSTEPLQVVDWIALAQHYAAEIANLSPDDLHNRFQARRSGT